MPRRSPRDSSKQHKMKNDKSAGAEKSQANKRETVDAADLSALLHDDFDGENEVGGGQQGRANFSSHHGKRDTIDAAELSAFFNSSTYDISGSTEDDTQSFNFNLSSLSSPSLKHSISGISSNQVRDKAAPSPSVRKSPRLQKKSEARDGGEVSESQQAKDKQGQNKDKNVLRSNKPQIQERRETIDVEDLKSLLDDDDDARDSVLQEGESHSLNRRTELMQGRRETVDGNDFDALMMSGSDSPHSSQLEHSGASGGASYRHRPSSQSPLSMSSSSVQFLHHPPAVSPTSGDHNINADAHSYSSDSELGDKGKAAGREDRVEDSSRRQSLEAGDLQALLCVSNGDESSHGVSFEPDRFGMSSMREERGEEGGGVAKRRETVDAEDFLAMMAEDDEEQSQDKHSDERSFDSSASPSLSRSRSGSHRMSTSKAQKALKRRRRSRSAGVLRRETVDSTEIAGLMAEESDDLRSKNSFTSSINNDMDNDSDDEYKSDTTSAKYAASSNKSKNKRETVDAADLQALMMEDSAAEDSRLTESRNQSVEFKEGARIVREEERDNQNGVPEENNHNNSASRRQRDTIETEELERLIASQDLSDEVSCTVSVSMGNLDDTVQEKVEQEEEIEAENEVEKKKEGEEEEEEEEGMKFARRETADTNDIAHLLNEDDDAAPAHSVPRTHHSSTQARRSGQAKTVKLRHARGKAEEGKEEEEGSGSEEESVQSKDSIDTIALMASIAQVVSPQENAQKIREKREKSAKAAEEDGESLHNSVFNSSLGSGTASSLSLSLLHPSEALSPPLQGDMMGSNDSSEVRGAESFSPNPTGGRRETVDTHDLEKIAAALAEDDENFSGDRYQIVQKSTEKSVDLSFGSALSSGAGKRQAQQRGITSGATASSAQRRSKGSGQRGGKGKGRGKRDKVREKSGDEKEEEEEDEETISVVSMVSYDGSLATVDTLELMDAVQETIEDELPPNRRQQQQSVRDALNVSGSTNRSMVSLGGLLERARSNPSDTPEGEINNNNNNSSNDSDNNNDDSDGGGDVDAPDFDEAISAARLEEAEKKAHPKNKNMKGKAGSVSPNPGGKRGKKRNSTELFDVNLAAASSSSSSSSSSVALPAATVSVGKFSMLPPSTGPAGGARVLKSCLSSARKQLHMEGMTGGAGATGGLNVSFSSVKKTVIFGSPNVAEFSKLSPTTNLTPMNKREASSLYSMKASDGDHSGQDGSGSGGGASSPGADDQITQENSRILEEWDRLTNASDSSSDDPMMSSSVDGSFENSVVQEQRQQLQRGRVQVAGKRRRLSKLQPVIPNLSPVSPSAQDDEEGKEENGEGTRAKGGGGQRDSSAEVDCFAPESVDVSTMSGALQNSGFTGTVSLPGNLQDLLAQHAEQENKGPKKDKTTKSGAKLVKKGGGLFESIAAGEHPDVSLSDSGAVFTNSRSSSVLDHTEEIESDLGALMHRMDRSTASFSSASPTYSISTSGKEDSVGAERELSLAQCLRGGRAAVAGGRGSDASDSTRSGHSISSGEQSSCAPSALRERLEASSICSDRSSNVSSNTLGSLLGLSASVPSAESAEPSSRSLHATQQGSVDADQQWYRCDKEILEGETEGEKNRDTSSSFVRSGVMCDGETVGLEANLSDLMENVHASSSSPTSNHSTYAGSRSIAIYSSDPYRDVVQSFEDGDAAELSMIAPDPQDSHLAPSKHSATGIAGSAKAAAADDIGKGEEDVEGDHFSPLDISQTEDRVDAREAAESAVGNAGSGGCWGGGSALSSVPEQESDNSMEIFEGGPLEQGSCTEQNGSSPSLVHNHPPNSHSKPHSPTFLSSSFAASHTLPLRPHDLSYPRHQHPQNHSNNNNNVMMTTMEQKREPSAASDMLSRIKSLNRDARRNSLAQCATPGGAPRSSIGTITTTATAAAVKAAGGGGSEGGGGESGTGLKGVSTENGGIADVFLTEGASIVENTPSRVTLQMRRRESWRQSLTAASIAAAAVPAPPLTVTPAAPLQSKAFVPVVGLASASLPAAAGPRGVSAPVGAPVHSMLPPRSNSSSFSSSSAAVTSTALSATVPFFSVPLLPPTSAGSATIITTQTASAVESNAKAHTMHSSSISESSESNDPKNTSSSSPEEHDIETGLGYRQRPHYQKKQQQQQLAQHVCGDALNVATSVPYPNQLSTIEESLPVGLSYPSSSPFPIPSVSFKLELSSPSAAIGTAVDDGIYNTLLDLCDAVRSLKNSLQSAYPPPTSTFAFAAGPFPAGERVSHNSEAYGVAVDVLKHQLLKFYVHCPSLAIFDQATIAAVFEEQWESAGLHRGKTSSERYAEFALASHTSADRHPQSLSAAISTTKTTTIAAVVREQPLTKTAAVPAAVVDDQEDSMMIDWKQQWMSASTRAVLHQTELLRLSRKRDCTAYNSLISAATSSSLCSTVGPAETETEANNMTAEKRFFTKALLDGSAVPSDGPLARFHSLRQQSPEQQQEQPQLSHSTSSSARFSTLHELLQECEKQHQAALAKLAEEHRVLSERTALCELVARLGFCRVEIFKSSCLQVLAHLTQSVSVRICISFSKTSATLPPCKRRAGGGREKVGNRRVSHGPAVPVLRVDEVALTVIGTDNNDDGMVVEGEKEEEVAQQRLESQIALGFYHCCMTAQQGETEKRSPQVPGGKGRGGVKGSRKSRQKKGEGEAATAATATAGPLSATAVSGLRVAADIPDFLRKVNGYIASLRVLLSGLPEHMCGASESAKARGALFLRGITFDPNTKLFIASATTAATISVSGPDPATVASITTSPTILSAARSRKRKSMALNEEEKEGEQREAGKNEEVTVPALDVLGLLMRASKGSTGLLPPEKRVTTRTLIDLFSQQQRHEPTAAPSSTSSDLSSEKKRRRMSKGSFASSNSNTRATSFTTTPSYTAEKVMIVDATRLKRDSMNRPCEGDENTPLQFAHVSRSKELTGKDAMHVVVVTEKEAEELSGSKAAAVKAKRARKALTSTVGSSSLSNIKSSSSTRRMSV